MILNLRLVGNYFLILRYMLKLTFIQRRLFYAKVALGKNCFYIETFMFQYIRKVSKMEKAIKVSGLYVSYVGNEVLKNIDFSFDHGNLIGIIGPNGAGKSTLIKAILSLIPKDCGTVTFSGKPIQSVQKKIAYVQQRSDIDWDFPIIVEDTVLLGTYPKLGLFKRPSKKDRNFARQCLKKVGMEHFAKRQIRNLSGGQQQRVFIARALAQRAQYLFLDEPFVGVDASSERTIMDILKELRDEGKMIFVVHHDLTTVEQYFDQLILLNQELIQAGNVEDVFQPKWMQKTYQIQFPYFAKTGESD